MKTIKNILILIAFIPILLITNDIKAQNIYKDNADTVRFSGDFYMLAKTNGNIVYYTYDLSQFKTEFENLYFKDFITNSDGFTFNTILFKDGIEAVFAIDKKYSTNDVLHFYAVARKMTMTENFRFSLDEKKAFVKKVKETKNN